MKQLTGEIIHAAFMQLEPQSRSWNNLSEKGREMYNGVAQILNEQLAIQPTQYVEIGKRLGCASCHMMVDPDGLQAHVCPSL